MDTGGTPKTGCCVCATVPGVDGGAPTNAWKCASTSEWPPQ
jgi:hypothetical protein